MKKIIDTMKSANKNKVKATVKPAINKEPQIKERQIEESLKDLKQVDLPIKDESPLKEVQKDDIENNEEEQKKEKAVMPSTELLDRLSLIHI